MSKNVIVWKNTVLQTNTFFWHSYGCLGSKYSHLQNYEVLLSFSSWTLYIIILWIVGLLGTPKWSQFRLVKIVLKVLQGQNWTATTKMRNHSKQQHEGKSSGFFRKCVANRHGHLMQFMWNISWGHPSDSQGSSMQSLGSPPWPQCFHMFKKSTSNWMVW